MVSQSQKDILNNFYNYEIIFDKKNEKNLDEKIEEEETNSEKLFINGLGKNEKKI